MGGRWVWRVLPTTLSWLNTQKTPKTPSSLKMQSLLSKPRTPNSPTGQDTPNTSPQLSHQDHMNSRRKMTVHGSKNTWECFLRKKMKHHPQVKLQMILSQ